MGSRDGAAVFVAACHSQTAVFVNVVHIARCELVWQARGVLQVHSVGLGGVLQLRSPHSAAFEYFETVLWG